MKKKLLSMLMVAASVFGSSAATTSENLYVVGSACSAGWSPEKALEMTNIAENVFIWTGELNASGEFKFLVSRNWDPCITCNFNTENQQNTIVENNGEYNLYERPNGNTGKDNKFVVSTTGEYTLNVDLNEMTMSVTLNKTIEQLYIVGNATEGGWNLENAMNQKLTKLKDGHYTWTGTLSVNEGDDKSGCFRFISQKNWWEKSYTTVKENENANVGVGDYEIRYCENRPSNEVSFRIQKTGIYTIDLDIEKLIMTISEKEEELYLIGNALLDGGDPIWDLSWSSQCKRIGEHEFEWSGKLFSKDSTGDDAKFKFICQNNDWNPGFVSVVENQAIAIGENYDIVSTKGNPDYKFTVPTDGDYRLVINTSNKTMKVEKAQTTGINTVANSKSTVIVEGRRFASTSSAFSVYNLMGTTIASDVYEVEVPEAGVYVVISNGKVQKIAVK